MVPLAHVACILYELTHGPKYLRNLQWVLVKKYGLRCPFKEFQEQLNCMEKRKLIEKVDMGLPLYFHRITKKGEKHLLIGSS